MTVDDLICQNIPGDNTPQRMGDKADLPRESAPVVLAEFLNDGVELVDDQVDDLVVMLVRHEVQRVEHGVIGERPHVRDCVERYVVEAGRGDAGVVLPREALESAAGEETS